MAKKKRHSAAEIAAKLLEADGLSAKGQTQAEIAKALRVSVMTIHRWRKMRDENFRGRAPETCAFSHRKPVSRALPNCSSKMRA